VNRRDIPSLDGERETASGEGHPVAEEVIGGYRLLNCMNTGQSSQVWECVEVSSSRHFAMKILLPEKAGDSDVRKLIIHEAYVGKQLAHQNIIRIVAEGTKEKTPYYVMEYFPAGSLKIRLIRKQHDFIRERVHNILKQAAIGLAYMNASGWVHRDVKPDNILVNSAGEVRLIDFALAQRVEGKPGLLGRLFRRKPVVQGTKSYMSPEQIRGDYLDARADIYSFAASAYELTTQRPPFRGMTASDLLQKQIYEKATPPQVFNADLTDEFSNLIVKCLSKKREERPESFHEVLKVLNSIRVHKTEPAKRPE
jgi:serine/threonine protein kinase